MGERSVHIRSNIDLRLNSGPQTSLLPTNLPRAHYLRLSTVGEKLGRKRTRRADTNLPAKVHIINSTRNVPANATYSESFNFFHLFTVLQSPLPGMAIPSLFDYSQITTLFKLQAYRRVVV